MKQNNKKSPKIVENNLIESRTTCRLNHSTSKNEMANSFIFLNYLKKRILIFSLIYFITGILTTGSAQFELHSPNHAKNKGGLSDWFDKENVFAEDLDYTLCVLSNTTSIYYKSSQLLINDFLFTIPETATITGYEITFIKADYAYGNKIKDSMVKLAKKGIPIGSNRKKVGTWPYSVWHTSPSSVYGSSTDLWGTTLTPDAVNNSDFGVIFQCENTSSTVGGIWAYVDYCSINVYYTDGLRMMSQESTSRKHNLNVFPNPVREALTISFESNAEEFQLYIINAIGQTVLEQKQNAAEGFTQRQINVSDLPKGIYFLNIITSEGSTTKRFIKQ